MRGHERIQKLRGLIVPEPVITGLKPYVPPHVITTMYVYINGLYQLPGKPIGMVWQQEVDTMVMGFLRPNSQPAYERSVWEASVQSAGSTIYEGWECIGCEMALPKYGTPSMLYLFSKKIEGLSNG